MILPAVEHETTSTPRYSILWLHGLGADGHDFAPIVAELVAADWPGLRFVFPHAPVRPITINGGTPMRAWYDVLGFDRETRQDEAGIRTSIEAVEALIQRENERGIPSQRIFLAGFSQGGAVALSSGLRHTEPLAGIIALSTYLPLADSLTQEQCPANAKLPVFWGHGNADTVLPQAMGLAGRTQLEQWGHPVAWHSYPMGHEVCAAEVADLRRWLEQRLNP